MKDALAQQFSGLHQKITHFGSGSFQPGLNLEVAEKMLVGKDKGLSFEAMKINVMRARIKELENDIVSMIVDRGRTVFSTDSLLGESWKGMKDTVRAAKEKNPDLEQLYEDIVCLPSALRAYAEMMKDRGDTEGALSFLSIDSLSPEESKELADIVFSEWQITEGLWRQIARAVESFNKYNQSVLAKTSN